jgi:hypothetical protein
MAVIILVHEWASMHYMRRVRMRATDARTRSPDLNVNRQDCRYALTNSDLSSHAIDQLLGIVANPCLKHCFDVLDLVDSF